jgi:hypothetical protein
MKKITIIIAMLIMSISAKAQYTGGSGDGFASKNSPNDLFGKIKYANSAQTPMNNCIIILKNSSNVEISRDTTDSIGNYYFANVPNGTYNIEVITNKSYGGVNSLDVLPLRQQIGGIISISPIKQKAGDINNSGTLSSLDILPLRQKIANITAPNWLIQNYVFYPNTVTMSDSFKLLNIEALCGGDVNGSFVPSGN